MGSETILLVDDEPYVLEAIVRKLRNSFTIQTASSGEEALQLLKTKGPCAVVVSDMSMPGMGGIELLAKVKSLYPQTIRIMLTGHADLGNAIESVNTGQIFRFLTKPCSVSVLEFALRQGLRQYELLQAERDLLNNTLKNSIKVLCELLGLANASAFRSSYRLREIAVYMAERLAIGKKWQIEIAALLSQVGCVTLPRDVLEKYHAGVPLGAEERQMCESHPQIAEKLIKQIPRLEKVAAIIGMQKPPREKWDGDHEALLRDEVRVGAQILQIALAYDCLLGYGESHASALAILQRQSLYDPELLSVLAAYEGWIRHGNIARISYQDLLPGMVMAEDAIAKDGAVLIRKDEEVSWAKIQSLDSLFKYIGIQEPLVVYVKSVPPANDVHAR
ncbi:MAG: response regulator [Proteobacteria bacterium]|nr:response regulator [Pseudomonadota bacterium]MBU1647954.1 response regulator [Pseudomonadota bacterium]